MLDELQAMEREALAAVRAAADGDVLGAVEATWIGRKGRITGILRSVGTLPAEQRGPVGQAANLARRAVDEALSARRTELLAGAEARLADTEWVDATLPPPAARAGVRRTGGTIHPITALTREIEDVFLSMGFDTLDGPWVEDDFHNFGALNMPADHPARDMQDTYWLSDGNLLRTHTSPVQVRAMESGAPPIRAVCLGRVFRHEELDATHENTFHQIEGFYVDRGVSVGHMLYVLRTLLREVLDDDVEVRLRPSYFPFVEPGFEMDVTFRGKWMELLGCGMVHPYVLEQGGIDPTVFSGFAFGLGIDRLVMLKHGVEDLRHFMDGDLRFLRQFGGGLEG
ncbi:MAG: phenylalanine--tRNA ligase subunit alpha [Planctomycetota bacterium]|nr:phenylalanine--tRNA ligase subunit alpha [Planctomycetota bacterium]